jgi:DNA-binding transcriptional regulator YiaG
VIPFTEKTQKINFIITISNFPPLKPIILEEQIKAERLKLDWTDYELGEYLGVSYATIYHWENGGTVCRLKHRRLVSFFLGM